MKEKEYVFIINPETGERKATYLVGIHGTRDKIMEKASADYPGDLQVIGDDEMFNKLVGENKLYINGDFVDRPPYIPPLESVKAAKLAELKGIRDTKELEPVQYAGHSYDFDTKSFDRINAAIIALDQTHGTIGWTTADNSVVEVTADTLRGVIAAAAVRSNALHVTYRTLKQQVSEATTNEEVEAISWPEV